MKLAQTVDLSHRKGQNVKKTLRLK